MFKLIIAWIIIVMSIGTILLFMYKLGGLAVIGMLFGLLLIAMIISWAIMKVITGR